MLTNNPARKSPIASAQINGLEYYAQEAWTTQRPKVLVVSCSDGRLQKSIDDFLQTHLNIHDYDRLYVPGGSGALCPGGYEFIRAEHYRRELLFLAKAHHSEQIILIPHGAAVDGPVETSCAHYRRLMPNATMAEIYKRQQDDITEFLKSVSFDLAGVDLKAYRAEVTADLRVRFTVLSCDPAFK